MTDGWNNLELGERALASEIFAASMAADELLPIRDPEKGAVIGASRIHALADDPGIELDDEVRAALAERPRLAELLAGLIRDDPIVAFPRAAAAADDATVDRRLADGFRIRLVPSKSTDGQTYVIIDLPLGHAAPASALFIVRADAMPWKVRLPQPMHGQIQLLAEDNSPLVVGLSDPEAEIFLR